MRQEGEPKMNGYTTWAKLGFNAPLSANAQSLLASKGFPARDIGELHEQGEASAKGWRQYGNTFRGTFNLEPTSRSSGILNAYRIARSIQ